MKTFINLSILLIISISSYSQDLKKIFDTAFYKVIFIKCDYITTKGDTMNSEGLGFLINSDYVGTCHHVIYQKDSTQKLIKIHVAYNIRFAGNKQLYDEISATPIFNVTANQYDFSKHHYEHSDYSTDFVILKLSKSIPLSFFPLNRVSNRHLEEDESTFALGDTTVFDKYGRYSLEARFDELKYLGYTIRNNTPFITAIGYPSQGFSGSLLYDKDGNVLGMIQHGLTTYPTKYLDYLIESHQITASHLEKIKRGYENHKHIVYAVDIHYLIKTYMSGYLPE